MTTAYGRHVKFVCSGADQASLRDARKFKGFLAKLCHDIGMRPLEEPRVFAVEERVEKLGDPQEDEGGLTGVLVLSTSHIAAHGWPLRKLLILDVFSCREFVPATVDYLLREWFAPQEVRLFDFTESMVCPDGFVGPVEVESSVKARLFAQARG